MCTQIDAIIGTRSIAVAQPEYLRIAADLRRRIASGEYGPGDQIPTIPDLCEAYGVSPTTIRNALDLLRNEGLVESRARAGTRVRPRPPVHRMAADRYRNTGTPRATPFTRDQGIGWSEYRLDKRFERVQADAELAALFECEPGERLLARHFVFYDNDQPTQMSTSYVRWSDVVGTPVADPINEPWPGGTRAQMASLGIRVTRVTESLHGGDAHGGGGRRAEDRVRHPGAAVHAPAHRRHGTDRRGGASDRAARGHHRRGFRHRPG
jgi:GntR family transcriptional regulator